MLGEWAGWPEDRGGRAVRRRNVRGGVGSGAFGVRREPCCVWDVVVLLACHGLPFRGMRRGFKGALTTIGGGHSWASDVAKDLRGGGIDNGDVLQGGAFCWGDEAHERAAPR